MSAETRLKNSEAKKGKKNPMYGVRKTEEEKRVQSIKMKKRRDYYSGRCENPDELANVVYDKRELPSVIEADDSVSELTVSIEYYNTTIDFLNDIIKMIHGRTYHIKHAIEYQKFTAGF